MTEKRFISLLKGNLKGLSGREKEEILGDYREHFRLGCEEGKTEEEIAAALGDPAVLGRSNQAEFSGADAAPDSPVSEVLRVIVASLSLGFVNLIFVLGPWVGLAGALAGLWAAALSVALSGAASVLAVIFEPLLKLALPDMFITPGFGIRLAAVLAGIALACLGSLATIGMVYVTKGFLRGTVRYLRFNLKIIRK